MRAYHFYKPDKKYLLHIGGTVRKLRKKKNMTIEQLAKKCELHPKYIQGCETGVRNLSISVLNDICVKGLNITIKTFYLKT